MANMEERIEVPSESVAEKTARRQELERNLTWFVDHDDMEGLASFVERIAHFDSLTNVLNRKGFYAESQPELERIARLPGGQDRRTGEFVSFNVLFLDVDHFKAINDTYGHSAGDAALQKIADVLRTVLRDDDIIGRYGGEEFIVAFACSSKQSLVRRNRFLVAEKVRTALEKSGFAYNGTEIPLTASIGVAQLRTGEDDLDQIIRRADQAMYRAKQAGRNRVSIAEEPANPEEQEG